MSDEIAAALLGAVVGAFFGVLGTYVLDLRKGERARQERERDLERERRRQRESIATALLQDCRRLEFELREVYESPQPTRAALTRHVLFYDALRAQIPSLSAATVPPVDVFFGRVDHLFGASKLLRDIGKGHIESTPTREYELRCHAAFALHALPEAVRALRDEGGVLSTPFEWKSVTYPSVPDVPAPIFDDAAARHRSRLEAGQDALRRGV